MLQFIRLGWKSALRQPFVIMVLFLYRFAWGFALYELVKSVVVPLLYRYPGNASPERVKLFLAEIQFQLMKTDLIVPYVWLLLGLFAARMLLTPFLNAALYYSVEYTRLNNGYRFFKGMKELYKSFFLYYLLQMIITLGPIYFLIPIVKKMLSQAVSYEALLVHLLPWAAGLLIYGYLIRLAVMYLQFGRTANRPLFQSLACLLKGFLPILGIAAALLLLSFLISVAVLSVVFIWAGFWAILLYQLYRFVETFVSVWGITAQHEWYSSKTA
ncbi:hypothetical protein [Paenibacillus sp. J2TS4]|uniref:hypothetical protein n=1 Tax=Paenibacillus sp. J2TS4 TaxID=2807194 RepID=UPI001AFD57B4|nr:hypothetical protein [Paenibacillus sp. J2TS4]GIP36547.1 hypothetical protein J2TS4_57570 [Paenibacillus sp. J2TS4]